MTSSDKDKIRQMKMNGASYSQIAKMTKISKNTVKSYCKRNNLQDIGKQKNKKEENIICKNCGEKLQQTSGHRQKKFCSDKCRFTWWHGKDADIDRTSQYFFECKNCGKGFTSYGAKGRKYCSHECYVINRFKH